MLTKTVPLVDGLTSGDQTFIEAILKAPDAGDIIDASLESEKPVQTPQGWQLLVSPVLLEQHVLRRQVLSIGDFQGPLTMAELKKLSQADLQLLQAAAGELDQQLAAGIIARGRSAAPGAAAGGA